MPRWLSLIYIALLPLQLAALEVEDDSGQRIVLDAPAISIVALAPHITEQLFAIGAGGKIVGTVEYSDYPEAAKAIPRVGGYSRLDLERIVALQPDLVIGWQSGNNAQQLQRLETLGLTLYRSEPRHLDDIAEGMLRLGILSGHQGEAEQAAAAFRSGVRALREAVDNRVVRSVFYQIWNRPLMTVNGEHLISEVISLCGGENIFAALTALTPKLSQEAVIAADPEVIIASGMGQERPEWLDEWRRWPQMRAVKEGRLYVIDPSIIQRASPRLLEGAKTLCSLVGR